MLPVIGAVRPWADPSQTAIRRMPALARGSAASRYSLDGLWRFRLFERPEDVPEAALLGATDGAEWSTIGVPGVWTQTGVDDLPHYTNIVMPFAGPPPALPERNPTGVYRRILDAPARRTDDRAVLSIGGAFSVHAVYINGRFAGYGTDARLASEYDVTELLIDGANDIAIVVVRHSAHSYIEDQDAWWQAGLHRSITLSVGPAVSIADVRVDADWDPDAYRGTLAVRAVVAGEPVPGATSVRVTLTGHGLDVGTDRIEVDGAHTDTYRFRDFDASAAFGDLAVEPWSAESPVLYDCRVELFDAAGAALDVVNVRVGFRRVEIVGPDLLVNGRRVWIHGVNRHDHHPDRGAAVSVGDLRADLVQMRRHNITAIRTAHYPNRPEFLDLCDELGFYVVAEANIESHAYNWHLCDRPEYRQAWVERVARMVERDRNHPSVIMWSLGNESGYGANHDAAAGWLRRADLSRPLHYEDAIRTQGWLDGGRHATDVVCPMYPSIPEVAEYGRAVAEKRADRPFIMCEYSHAMGNANGSLADYWDVIHAWPGLQGGFIWEWKDHGLRHPKAPDGRLHYGGMFGESPHDANFIADGLVSSDLVPHPAMAEVAWVYRPVATRVADGDRLVIENRRAFRGLDDLRARWALIVDDALTEGELDVPEVPPGQSTAVPLPVAVPTDRFAVLTVTWETCADSWFAKAGHLMAADQHVVDGPPGADARGGSVTDVPGVLSGPEPQVWRGAIDNDGFKLMLDRAAAEPLGSQWLLRWLKQGLHSTPASELIDHRRVASPTIERHTFVVPERLDGLPRIGVRYEIAPRFTRMRWLGRGPGENYADRNRGSMIGIWESDIDRLPYLVPQEYGLRTDVRWVELHDPRTGDRIRIEAAAAPFSFSAIRHTAEQLFSVEHASDLLEHPSLVLSIDAAHRGVGNGACGSDTLADHEIRAGVHELSYRITAHTTSNSVYRQDRSAAL
ncbi:glycoside hydrolase family 2 TIM barrel-domain containing protein [Microbacterium awajiense]|uniref:Beta-galactosidase n=1 Tax=Microbacterium awajiense TaxID=415214 RepID=A0ABP7ASZ7_9MICO